MARAIDIQPIIEEIKSSLDISSYSEHDKGFDDGLEYVLDLIEKAPTLTPPNESLTLDELRKMDGAPVWVVPIGKCKWATRQWCVLAADEVLIPGVDHWWWSFEGYGETWIAYRRPPEGEERI